MLVQWQDQYKTDVIRLWNQCAVKDGYKEMNEARFEQTFASNRYFHPDNTFVWLKDGEVHGFACGCMGDDLPLGDKAGYVTCIVLSEELLREEYDAHDHYQIMLAALEERFRKAGKTQAEVLFFNPMQLPWYIPGTPRHEHNNAPGVPVDSIMYPALIRNGYMERTREVAMYLALGQFQISEEIRMKEQMAASKGYLVDMFDQAKHSGVRQMLTALRNPLWLQEIKDSTDTGVPVVIAAKEGRAVGFAGPVIRQENGRGYFAGIGVHPEHEGHGLGTILFFKLCEAFQNIGTEYMSLYTGLTNPAVRIYEKAGFRAVRQFSVMRKVL